MGVPEVREEAEPTNAPTRRTTIGSALAVGMAVAP